VLEAGTHEELMAMDGHYARLFRIQHLDKEPVGREA
jgi:ABC-type multidrug transport system fused ATPase/permease subunit